MSMSICACIHMSTCSKSRNKERYIEVNSNIYVPYLYALKRGYYLFHFLINYKYLIAHPSYR